MRSYIVLPILAAVVLGQWNGTVTTTSANIAPTTGPCATVYDKCIAAGNGSPNIAACQASRANCVGASLTSSAANATGGPVYTTKVVTAYTTYCPQATTLVNNGKTYTATASQTLTITNCPCTITTPVASATGNGKVTSAAGSGAGNSGAATKSSNGNNGAATATSGSSSATGSNTPTQFQGAASHAGPAFGLLAAIGALVMI